MSQEYANKTQILFDELQNRIFSDLKNNEELTLNLAGEKSLYVRLNANKVRQNTDVDQSKLSLMWQKNNRKINTSMNLTGDIEFDTQTATSLIHRSRAEANILPADPTVTAFKNLGSSEQKFSAKTLELNDFLQDLQQSTASLDLAGLMCSGDQIRANANNLGQKHWFSNHSFFFDYSLFTKNASGENKAVKNTLAGQEWNSSDFNQQILRAKSQINLLQKNNLTVNRGKYRVYLAPAATSELSGMLSWGALSYSQYKKGNGPLANLAEKKAKLSNLLTIQENFDLGLSTRFNNLGEVSDPKLTLVENGELKNFLISTGTAQEFNVKSNYASPSEAPRSLEILGGDLKENEILTKLGTGLYLGNLHYCNWSDLATARITGMTRYACFWVENGEIVAPINDLRFDISLYEAWGSQLEAISTDSAIDPSTDTYFLRSLGGKKVPGMLISDFQFTL